MISFNEDDFVALLENAADIHDIIDGRFFSFERPAKPMPQPGIVTGMSERKRLIDVAEQTNFKQWLVSSSSSAAKLRDRRRLPPWARHLRQILIACQTNKVVSDGPLVHRLVCSVMDFARAELRRRLRDQKHSLPADVVHCFEKQLEERLTSCLAPALKHNAEVFENAYRCVHGFATRFRSGEYEREFLSGNMAERLIQLLYDYPPLAKLVSQLAADWVRKVEELSSRLKADRRVLKRTFFRGRDPGAITAVEMDCSDPHSGGRETLIIHFRHGVVVYKPRSGRHEQAWFSLLRWGNRHGFVPRFRTLRILRRPNYCWMEFVRSRPCRTKLEAHSYYERGGGLICLAYMLGAIDCHIDNLVAAGDQPVLIDAETLFHEESPNIDQKNLTVLDRSGFLPRSDRSFGVQDISAFGRVSDMRRGVLKAKFLTVSAYSADVRRGFRQMWKLVHDGKTATGASFRRRVRVVASMPWRRIYRSTKTYYDIRLRSVQPFALRSGLDRSRAVASDLFRLRRTSASVSDEILALARFNIPYFTEVPSWTLPENDFSDLSRALTAGLTLTPSAARPKPGHNRRTCRANNLSPAK